MTHSIGIVPNRLRAVLLTAAITCAASAEPGGDIARLKYNNPGLVVDLGVGLWAWPLPMDFNGDGLMDLVVACTDTPSNGIHVFLNTGEIDPQTQLPLFGPGRNLGPAGRAPQISYVDSRPVVTTAGKVYPDFIETGFTQPVTLGDPDKIHQERGSADLSRNPVGAVRANQWRLVDFDGDGATDIVVGIGFWGDYGWDDAWDGHGRWKNGPLHGYVYLLRNSGTSGQPVYGAPEKIMTIADAPVDVYGMPSPSFGDFDADGDLDLLCGEFVDGFTYFENIGTRREPRYAPGRRLTVAGQPLTMDLCMITPVAVDFDSDGDLDLVVGDEDGRVAFIESTGQTIDGLPQFLSPRYFRQHADNVKFGALAAPVSVDWDGDGFEDLIVGNTAGHIGFIKNLGGNPSRWAAPRYLSAGGKLIREQAGPNGSIQGPAEAKWGYTNPSVADWDGDGLPDILTNGIWGKILFYKNIGTRTAPRLAEAQPVEVAWPGPTLKPTWIWWQPQGRELVTQWRTTPAIIDWNGDGLPDLVMLDQEGYLALFERRRDSGGRLELLPPQRVFRGDGVSAYDGSGRPLNAVSGLLRLNERPLGRSGRRTFTFHDWDADGEMDLLVNSDTNVNVLRGLGRDGSGYWRFRDIGPVHDRQLAAHSTTPTVARSPGQAPALVIGAEDGFFYTLPLSQP